MQKKIISILLAYIMAGILITSLPVAANDTALTEQNLDYTDKCETITNPERGFYDVGCWHLKPDGSDIEEWRLNGNIVHLRLDISEFSDNALISSTKTPVSSPSEVTQGEETANGRKVVTSLTTETVNNETIYYKTVNQYGISRPVTDEALDAVRRAFAKTRSKGHSIIVRLAYDPWFNGKANYEPDQSTILMHTEQFGKIFSEYKDVTSMVELGLYGPYGEEHTSKCCTRANCAEALQKMLDCTDKEIPVSPRNPRIVATWLGLSRDLHFNINDPEFIEKAAAKGDDFYRVGLYNDGYLGSAIDFGTWDGSITRELGTQWLEIVGKTTFYGGEALVDNGGKKDENGNPIYLNEYNSVAGLSSEGFRTHTSYLNIAWDNRLINEWKNEIYTGSDPVYNGQTGFKYINDHLGYRFVMTGSKLSDGENGGMFSTDIKLENVGFGNIVKPKKVTFILKKDDKVYELAPISPIDPTKFDSKTTTSITADVKLPIDIEGGIWNVYLRISRNGNYEEDNNYQCIRFANDLSYWDSKTGSNYVGKINISENKVEPEEISLNNVLDTIINVGYKEGQLYSIDGTNWQRSGCFSNLAPDTEYTVMTKTTTSDTILTATVTTLSQGSGTLVSKPAAISEDDYTLRTAAAVLGNNYEKNGFVINSTKHNSVILENNTLYTTFNGKNVSEVTNLEKGKYFVTAKISRIPSASEIITITPYVVSDGKVYYGESAEFTTGGTRK